MKLAALPATGAVTVLSIAPDGTHAVYRQDHGLFLLDLAPRKSTQLGQANAAFFGWSPDGTQVMYTSSDGNIASRIRRATVWASSRPGTRAGRARTRSCSGATPTSTQARSGRLRASTKLASGTYHLPVWAPNGTAFTFFRGGASGPRSAPALPPPPTVLDQATASSTRSCRRDRQGQADQADALLDNNGKQAYASGGAEPGDHRRSVLLAVLHPHPRAVTDTQPDTATFVVRLVLTHGKLDIADYEETLTVVRDAADQPVSSSTRRSPARTATSARVRRSSGVVVAADSIQVTFDSDLDSGTVADAVPCSTPRASRSSEPRPTRTARSRSAGLALTPGAQYRLVVLPRCATCCGHNVAAEYDLHLVGPVAKNNADRQERRRHAPRRSRRRRARPRARAQPPS